MWIVLNRSYRNEKTKKTPTSCVFPIKHLLWAEFNIYIKPQNISSRALQHFWSHDCAISWQRHVFYNLLLLSLIRPCCTSRPLQTLWTLDFQLVLKFTQNLLVKVVSSSILSIHITHLSCASVWSAERWWPGRQVSGSGKATPGPQPFCRTGSQSKSLYVRLFLSPWLRSLLVFEMWQITLNDPFLFPPHADLICLWKGLSHTPSSQAIWKSCNFESVWEISSSGCKEAKVQDHFQASVAE